MLAKAGLQRSRLRHYMASDYPDFESKAADIIGLYLKPPAAPQPDSESSNRTILTLWCLHPW